jgi:hypothetical protein
MTDDLPGSIAAAEKIAGDVTKRQARDSIVEEFGPAADDFDAKNPYAADSKRAAFLIGLAKQQAADRAASLRGGLEVLDVVLQSTTAAVEAAKVLPSEVEQLERERRPTGVSDQVRLLAELLADQRESRTLADLARGDVIAAEKLYDQAVTRRETTAIRTIEREVLNGLPQVSPRKGPSVENTTAFSRLRERVAANRAGRVPPDLAAAQSRLQAHRGRLKTWELVLAPYQHQGPDIDKLRADYAALRKARESAG